MQEAVAAAEADVSAKLADISRVEFAMRKADREIERKTRELDALNRRLQRAMEAAPDEESLGEEAEAVSLRNGTLNCFSAARSSCIYPRSSGWAEAGQRRTCSQGDAVTAIQ